MTIYLTCLLNLVLVGLVDQLKTYDYVEGVHAPKGEKFEAVADWKTLVSDPDAEYDKVITIDVSELAPMVTWELTLKWVLV